MTQILVVKPKTLNATDKKLLREAGVVCIEANNPRDVHLVQTEELPVCQSRLLNAAIQCIAGDSYSDNVKDAFMAKYAELVAESQAVPPNNQVERPR